MYTVYCLHLVWKAEAFASKIFKISQQMVHAVFQEDVLLFSPQSDSFGMFEQRLHLYTALEKRGEWIFASFRKGTIYQRTGIM